MKRNVLLFHLLFLPFCLFANAEALGGLDYFVYIFFDFPAICSLFLWILKKSGKKIEDGVIYGPLITILSVSFLISVVFLFLGTGLSNAVGTFIQVGIIPITILVLISFWDKVLPKIKNRTKVKE